MPASGRCSIFRSLTGIAARTDPLGDLQIGLPGVLEQLGKLGTDLGILLEQQLLELRAVNADDLFQMGSEKVHGKCPASNVARASPGRPITE